MVDWQNMTWEERRKATWEALADEARLGRRGADALVEAMRRQEASATKFAKRLESLNLWLLVYTIAIGLLTLVQLLVALGVMRPIGQ